MQFYTFCFPKFAKFHRDLIIKYYNFKYGHSSRGSKVTASTHILHITHPILIPVVKELSGILFIDFHASEFRSPEFIAMIPIRVLVTSGHAHLMTSSTSVFSTRESKSRISKEHIDWSLKSKPFSPSSLPFSSRRDVSSLPSFVQRRGISSFRFCPGLLCKMYLTLIVLSKRITAAATAYYLLLFMPTCWKNRC